MTAFDVNFVKIKLKTKQNILPAPDILLSNIEEMIRNEELVFAAAVNTSQVSHSYLLHYCMK